MLGVRCGQHGGLHGPGHEAVLGAEARVVEDGGVPAVRDVVVVVVIPVQGAVRVLREEVVLLRLRAVGGAGHGDGRGHPLGAHCGAHRVHVQLDVVAVVLLEQRALGLVPVAPERGLVLVVGGPDDHAGVAAEAAVLLAHLRVDGAQEGLAHGVHGAGEHEVLPHHDAQLVGELVEHVRLVHAAAPDAQHVHVGLLGGVQEVGDGCRVAAHLGEHVGGDPVGALGEHGHAVDAEVVRESLLGVGLVHGVLHQLHGAEARPDGHGVPHVPAVGLAPVRELTQSHFDGVQGLRAVAARPPQPHAVLGQGEADVREADALLVGGQRGGDVLAGGQLAVGVGQGDAEQRAGRGPVLRGAHAAHARLPVRAHRYLPLASLGVRSEAHVAQHRRVVRLDVGALPQTHGREGGAPVPGEGGLHLPQVVNAALATVAGVGAGRRHHVLLGLLSGAAGRLAHRGREADLQRVGVGLEDALDVEAVADEHVVRGAEDVAVEHHLGHRVHAVQHEHLLVLSQDAGRHLEGAVVGPVGLGHPAVVLVVEAVEDVLGQLAGRAEVGVHAPGHGTGHLQSCRLAGQRPDSVEGSLVRAKPRTPAPGRRRRHRPQEEHGDDREALQQLPHGLDGLVDER